MLVKKTSQTNEEITKKKRQRRSFIRFLCSNLVLILIVVGYSIGGAYLFILLEQYIESQNCQQASLQENATISNLSESMYSHVTYSKEDTTVIYEQIVAYLENFTNSVYELKNDNHYTGQDCKTGSKWTFPSALLFTITIITTIGYGHITPISWEGQLTCICYALIGIPIFLLCLANISSILADIFRFLYSTFLHCIFCCCRIYTRSRRRRRIRSKKPLNKQTTEYIGTISVDPYWTDANDQSDDENFNNNNKNDDHEINDIWYRMENRVPVLVVVSIIVSYIYLGALMFNKFENWTMSESIYFCYITIATIGFGDYVPDVTSNSSEGFHFFATCAYIIIGLAVLAMCFDLIKESIVDKFAWFGHKFGFVHDDDDHQIDDQPTRYTHIEYSNSPPTY